MRAPTLVLLASCLLISVVALPRSLRTPAPSYLLSWTNLERQRLREHFDSVDSELRSPAISGLALSQRTARSNLIGWLRDYRNAGRFPRNERSRQATPFFRDSRWILCAMAYLINRSGHTNLLNRIAGTNNNAYATR